MNINESFSFLRCSVYLNITHKKMPTFRQSIVSQFTRLYPFYSGCGTFANSKILTLIAGISDEQVWSKVQGGEVLASLNDYVGKAVYYVGELDRKISWICSRLVEQGDTVLDIGANIGIVTLHLSQLTKKNGMVYSFEPNPYLVSILKETIVRNSLTNVQLFPVALGNKPSMLELEIPEGNMGAASLVRRNTSINHKMVKVEVNTLSNIVEHEKIKNIKLIKIDVEGFEASVFAGGLSVLKEVKPTAILFELNQYSGSFWQQPVVEILQECGYSFFSIPKSFMKMRLLKITNYQSEKIIGNDFLAVPHGEIYLKVSHLVNAV